MIAQSAGITRTENRRMIGFDRDSERERTRNYPIPNDNNDPNGRADGPKREYMPYPPLNPNNRREEAYYGGYDPYQRYEPRTPYDAYMPRQTYPMQPYPMENRMGERREGNQYGDIYAHGTIYAPGAMNKGMISGEREKKHVDEHKARSWVQKMSGGEKFRIEQTEQQRLTACPQCEKWEFYVAMNAMYSDHNKTLKQLGTDKAEAYAMLAKDFLMDEDAVDDKLTRYMETIAK